VLPLWLVPHKVLGRTAMETHPAVALFNSGYQAVTGKDAIDYHELSTSERVWSGVGAGLEVAGKAVKVAASVGTAVATVKAVEGAGDLNRAKKLAEGAAGRLGGAAHRAKVAERAKQLEKEGHKIVAGGGLRPERGVRTPEGKLRYPDIATRSPSGEPYYENVGKTTLSGQPISRERAALSDIERATNIKPGFTPLDK